MSPSESTAVLEPPADVASPFELSPVIGKAVSLTSLELTRRAGEGLMRHFVYPLSFEGLQESFWNDPKPAGSMLVFDCVSDGTVSLGVPVDLLGMIARQIIFNRVFGMTEINLLVNGAGPTSSAPEVEQRRQVEFLTGWIQQTVAVVSKYLSRHEHDMSIRTFTDGELRKLPEYRRALEQSARLHAGAISDEQQREVLLEALRLLTEAPVKVGWSAYDSKEQVENAASVAVTDQGGIEEASDAVKDVSLNRAFPGKFSCVYAPPAVSRLSVDGVSPLRVTPTLVAKRGAGLCALLSGDGEIEHGRVMLRRGEDLDPFLLPVAEVGGECCSEKRRAQLQIQQARAVDSLFDVCELVTDAMPGLELPRDLEAEKALELGGVNSSQKVNELKRRSMLPRLRAILETFGLGA